MQEQGTNLPLTSYREALFFQPGKPRWITKRSSSKEVKVDFFLEMLISDAFTLTDTTDTSIKFLDGDNDMEIPGVEPVEVMVGLHDHVCDLELHEKA